MQSPKVKQLLANKRFIAIVGMLGSNGSGEAANAAALATKMLQEAGLTWAELVNAVPASGGPDPRQSADFRILDALHRTQDALANIQRKNEALLSDLQAQKRHVSKLKLELDDGKRMIASLEAALKKANEQRRAAPGGFHFTDAPEEDQRPRNAPPRDEAFQTRTYREIKDWLDRLVKEAWDDLSEWEVGFFTDFYEKKRALLTEKQYAVFKRTAEKTGLPLDF